MTASPEWSPERTIDLGQATRAIATQFPELAGLPVGAFDSGWDNLVLAVGDDWVFRFIHREVALPGAARELAVLTALANRFAVPVPHPEHVGTPVPGLDWPFWGTRRLPGHEIARAGLADDARVPAARALGLFLRDLHSPALADEVSAAVTARGVTLPVDPMRRADSRHVLGRARDRLARLAHDGVALPSRLPDLLDRAAALDPPTGAVVLVHGDLHVRHVLVDDDGTVTGVIDWGDTALGDPAVDLMIAFSAFTGPARTEFFDAYGAVDPERETRARMLAVHVCATLAEYARAERMHDVAAEAVRGMARAVD